MEDTTQNKLAAAGPTEAARKPESKAKKSTKAPERVEMTHPKMRGTARPLAKDKAAWIARGWTEKSANIAD